MRKQVIGIDWASGKDLTVATSVCGSCKTVIGHEIISDPNKVNVTIHKKCPLCGAVFKGHKIL